MEYLILGLLLGISPCMLPLIPIILGLLGDSLASLYQKSTFILLFTVVSILSSCITVYLLYSFPSVVVFLQSILPIILVVAGLIWLDLVIITPQITYISNSNIISALMMPLLAGGCVLPGYALLLSSSHNLFIDLLMLNLGLNASLIVAILISPIRIPKGVSRYTSYIKKLLGLVVLAYGLSFGGTASAEQLHAPQGTNRYLLFSADWCSVCIALKSNLGDLKAKNIELVDLTKLTPNNMALIKQYGAQYIPLFVKVDRQGNILTKISGNKPKKIMKVINESDKSTSSAQSAPKKEIN